MRRGKETRKGANFDKKKKIKRKKKHNILDDAYRETLITTSSLVTGDVFTLFYFKNCGLLIAEEQQFPSAT